MYFAQSILQTFSTFAGLGNHLSNILAKPGAVIRGDTRGKTAFIPVAFRYQYRHYMYYFGTYGGKLAGDERAE